MPEKTIEHVAIHDAHHDVHATIPIGTAVGDEDGPTLGVIGAVRVESFPRTRFFSRMLTVPPTRSTSASSARSISLRRAPV